VARVYATADDLAAWLGDYPPVNAVVLCTRASADIDDLLIGAVYDTSTVTELPTDAAVIEALKLAVCAQVASWLPTQGQEGMGPQADGWPRLSRAQRSCPMPDMGQVCEEAVRILHTAGLLPVTPWPVG
jgi:hypothetical protein